MKKIIILIIYLSIIIFPGFALAQVSGNVAISTTIDSKVSKTHSIITLSANETLADPSSHSILITIKLRDASDNPLPGIDVVLTSSRGSVDAIEAVSKIGTGQPYDQMRRDKTDANGMTSFRISSFIPGKTTITIVADELITFDPIDLQFDPLPFPSNVTVEVSIPGTGRRITLYSPKPEEGNLTNLQLESKKLVNTGTKITISFWVFILFWILILVSPVFIILNYISNRKIKQMEAQELLYLQKIEQKENQRS
jgi:hypothetical protein